MIAIKSQSTSADLSQTYRNSESSCERSASVSRLNRPLSVSELSRCRDFQLNMRFLSHEGTTDCLSFDLSDKGIPRSRECSI